MGRSMLTNASLIFSRAVTLSLSGGIEYESYLVDGLGHFSHESN